MNEERVIALAGLFQAVTLVRQVATEGSADPVALKTSIASVLKIDADSPADVFGGLGGVRLGLETLLSQLDGDQRDLSIAQTAISVLQLQRRLEKRKDMLVALRAGIASIQRQAEHLGIDHPAVMNRLAELYADTLSHLRPRVVVQGNPLHLTQSAKVEQIRATLMAGVRAAVLWRQLGGRQWRLLLNRREYTMLARGMLARCTLDGV
jgi:high frequency lysogenization protein